MYRDRIKRLLMSPLLSLGGKKITRKALSWCYIKGSGLEIGALWNPLTVSKGTVVKNVDLYSRDENIQNYPELDPASIAITDYLEDGFELTSIPDASQEFIIANHVLEHALNPIQVLCNWSKKITTNGVIYISVPIGEKSFDRGRPLTTLEHLVDDFNLYSQGELKRVEGRNREHVAEWVNVSEQNILMARNGGYVAPSSEELMKRIDQTDIEKCSIHFHTFSVTSFKSFLSYVTAKIDNTLSVEEVVINRDEIIAVLRKI